MTGAGDRRGVDDADASGETLKLNFKLSSRDTLLNYYIT